MMKAFKLAFLDAIGVTALKTQLHRIENSMSSMNQTQTERELRAAGWAAAIANRQLKLEQAVLDLEVSLRHISEKIESGTVGHDVRLEQLRLEWNHLRQSVTQVRDSDQEST